MSMTNFYMGSLRYDPSGRKRKKHAANPVRKKRIESNITTKPCPYRQARMEAAEKHKKMYPSMMEEQIKAGTFTQGGNTMGKQEPMKYTGNLVKGIATMHKSNAVPVINQQEATDIARMRRG